MRSKLTISGANSPKFSGLSVGKFFLSRNPLKSGCLYVKTAPAHGSMGYNAVCVYSDNSQDADHVGDKRFFESGDPITQVRIDEIKGTAV